MSDFETNPVGTAKRLASLEPQPIVLPSVDEAREVLRQSEGRFLTDAAQAVLDLIASRCNTWQRIEAGATIEKGTKFRFESLLFDGNAVEGTAVNTSRAAKNGRWFIERKPSEQVDPLVEKVAKAIHDAEESDTEQWTCEPEGARETYRRLARAAMAAIA